MKKNIYQVLLAVSIVIANNAFARGASNYVTVDRYTTVASKPTPSQINPLLALIQVTFPQDVVTVGDAVNYLLRYSGYTLVAESKMEPELIATLHKPLPLVDRKLGPLKLQDALLVLVGQHVFTLVQDPIHRQLSFHLSVDVASVMHKNNVSTKKGDKSE